jgi:AraC-like DNA-binding protein
MKIPFEILLLTSSVGALQSAFFGVYLFTVKKGNKLANRLLASLLLAFAMRMTKSVSYYFAEGHSIPRLFENIGYAAHLAILPLSWLYLNAFLRKNYRPAWIRDWIHLLPSALIVLLSPFITANFWLGKFGYTISLLLMGAYLPFCFYLFQKHFKSINRHQQIWILCVLAGVTLIWVGYSANFLFGLVSYITTPVIFSFIMYFMSYLGLKQNNFFIQEIKYRNSAFSVLETEKCFTKLQELIAKENPYKDAAITLPKLARLLAVSPNLLSQTINEKANQNFPDFINSYRIKEAQLLLSNPKSGNQKIASIAFDTGFNTLSAFNAAFKKFTFMTPSDYRKKVAIS